MHPIEFIVRGVIAGFAISAPIGPVNIFCISRGIAKGRTAGVIAGVGAACADTIYGGIAGFSLHYIIYFLLREEFWIRVVGGSLLIVMGIVYFFRPPKAVDATAMQSGRSDLLTALVLNLTNPTTVLSFLAVLAALHLRDTRGWPSLYLVGGIFVGAMVWWIVLAIASSHFKERFDRRALCRLNQVAGASISLFGVAVVASSF